MAMNNRSCDLHFFVAFGERCIMGIDSDQNLNGVREILTFQL